MFTKSSFAFCVSWHTTISNGSDLFIEFTCSVNGYADGAGGRRENRTVRGIGEENMYENWDLENHVIIADEDIPFEKSTKYYEEEEE